MIAQTSPLRVKNLNADNFAKNFEEEKKKKQDASKFYSQDSSDIEKVIVCSVISSARPEGEESLQNTQKYMPLRQKVNKKPGIPSSTSSVTSGFNTAIKTNQGIPIQ